MMTASFMILSSAFNSGDSIPVLYTCDGDDISPPLLFSNVPAGTVGLAIVCDDPDAPGGTWTHWVLFNIPASTESLPAALPVDARLPDGSQQGLNSWGRTGYGGPCPPSGTHRYFFRAYALDCVIELPSRARAEQVLRAMEGHVLMTAELMGTYSRGR
jgi:hypothetical protein